MANELDVFREKVARLRAEGLGRRLIARELGATLSRVQRAMNYLDATSEAEPPPAGTTNATREGEGWRLDWTDLSIPVEEAVRLAGFDLERWRIDRVKANAWDVTAKVGGRLQTKSNSQRTVWLSPVIPETTQAALELIAKTMPAPKWPPIKRPPKREGEKFLLEVSLIDHHFGKLGWEPEVGSDYDLKIARRLYLDAVHELVAAFEHRQVDRVLYVIGHDLLHSEGASEATASGTPQDCDGRWQKAYCTAFEAVAEGIEYFHANVAPVQVVVVPGNHDLTTSFYLGHSLQQRYMHSDILVNNSPRSRKRYRWGTVLLGLTHGSRRDDPPERDLPLLMAQEWAQDWAATTWREWHLGDTHIHTRSQTPSKPPKGFTRVDGTYAGVRVRRLPSLCGSDAWHYGHGFVGSRSSEAYLWSDTRGPAGSYEIPVDALL